MIVNVSPLCGRSSRYEIEDWLILLPSLYIKRVYHEVCFVARDMFHILQKIPH